MNKLSNIFIIIGFLIYAYPINGYSFTFSNHTNKKLNVRIKLSPSAFEDWIAPQELGPKDAANKTITFEVGGRKVGFCLSKIQVSAENMPWTPAFVQWVEGADGARFDRMLRATELFADGFADVAKVVAYETVDAQTLKKIDALKDKKRRVESHIGTLATVINKSPEELVSLSRTELEKQVQERFINPNGAKIKAGDVEVIAQQQKIKNILDELALDDLDLADTTESIIQKISTEGNDLMVKTTEGSTFAVDQVHNNIGKKLVPNNKDMQPYDYTKRLAQPDQKQSSEFFISDIIHVIGNLIKYSWCKSLQFDVVEDAGGIKFLVKVGQ